MNYNIVEDIRKGTELTLDYGPGYWGKEDQAMGVENNIDAESRREE
jgi:SET domain-containing protein